MPRSISKPKSAPQPSPAAAWRRPQTEGVVLPLPSGLYVRIRPLTIDAFVELGKSVPDLLTPIVMDMMETGTANLAGRIKTLADMQAYIELINVVVSAMCIEPRVLAEPPEMLSDDEVLASDMDFADKQHIMRFIGAPMALIRRFLDGEQGSDMEHLRPEQDAAPAPLNGDQRAIPEHEGIGYTRGLDSISS